MTMRGPSCSAAAHLAVLNLVSAPDVTDFRMGRLMANPRRSDP